VSTADRYLTRAEAAQKLGLSVRTVARLIASGELPAVRIRAAVRIDPNDLDALIDRHRIAS
jgi:excisionase family DNA binding protein